MPTRGGEWITRYKGKGVITSTKKSGHISLGIMHMDEIKGEKEANRVEKKTKHKLEKKKIVSNNKL